MNEFHSVIGAGVRGVGGVGYCGCGWSTDWFIIRLFSATALGVKVSWLGGCGGRVGLLSGIGLIAIFILSFSISL